MNRESDKPQFPEKETPLHLQSEQAENEVGREQVPGSGRGPGTTTEHRPREETTYGVGEGLGEGIGLADGLGEGLPEGLGERNSTGNSSFGWRDPNEHAGGKYRLTYMSAFGRSAGLAVDINYMFRTPLWPPTPLDSQPIALFVANAIPVLDLHELAAGKLAALFNRNASRDLFDTNALLRHDSMNAERLR